MEIDLRKSERVGGISWGACFDRMSDCSGSKLFDILNYPAC